MDPKRFLFTCLNLITPRAGICCALQPKGACLKKSQICYYSRLNSCCHKKLLRSFSENEDLRMPERKIAIAVDLSDESAYAVKWAVEQYLRPGDEVILLHVQPTSVLYGADWGVVDHSVALSDEDEESQQKKKEDDFDAFTSSKSSDLAKPLADANIPHRIHIVKDHDMKERICLEVERLGANAVIMGSRGFGASKVSRKGRLGSVSDYCVHHCDCPVVVVRLSDAAATLEPLPEAPEVLEESEAAAAEA